MKTMKELHGIPVSPGIGIGKVFLYLDNMALEIPRYDITRGQVEYEWSRFTAALSNAVAEVRSLYDQAVQEMSSDQAEIFQAHSMMLEDKQFHEQIRTKLENDLQNIEWIVWEVSHELIQKMSASPDAYLRERAADIAGVSHYILDWFVSNKKTSLAALPDHTILVAHDLMPADILSLDRSKVTGIVMDSGGRTAHTAILARAFEIPAVLGLSGITKNLNGAEVLVLNGDTGVVIIDPDAPTQKRYEKARSEYQKKLALFESLRKLPAQTRDGHTVKLHANIEIAEEAEQLSCYGADGIGLYRSEFLFLSSAHVASEEKQFQAYRRVIKIMGNLPVTIRTIDIGGDKVLPGIQQANNEKNPLLGWRAIRFCLARPGFFKTQLRAVLRASAFGTVRILFPLISGCEELEQVLTVLEEAKAECRQKGQLYDEHIAVGSMIEVPSAALTADILAEKSDFFSIGTNDLVQYTMAVDRGNEQVNHLAQPFHPAILRLIKYTIDSAHAKGIPAAMCGEFAGAPLATMLLLGLGLDEFSMTAQAIPIIKHIIRSVTWEQCRLLAEKALSCTAEQQVLRLLEEHNLERIGHGKSA
ncbi:MAG: phosphoenolpyruvate--protein phosphotransferase [Spirochaetaceae bacterium]|jgi:phosphotransferase system enzyme I (PtsI)|nr:phosphoenolpyruvate--protein phosphotransferase [Spirochaetaceae bacterium]